MKVLQQKHNSAASLQSSEFKPADTRVRERRDENKHAESRNTDGFLSSSGFHAALSLDVKEAVLGDAHCETLGFLQPEPPSSREPEGWRPVSETSCRNKLSASVSP